MNNTTAIEPLTYEDLERANDMLKQFSPPPPPQTIMGKDNFKYIMMLAKYYKAGAQVIKRNYHITGKKNRYRKTFTVPHFKIVNNECIELYGQKIFKAKQL